MEIDSCRRLQREEGDELFWTGRETIQYRVAIAFSTKIWGIDEISLCKRECCIDLETQIFDWFRVLLLSSNISFEISNSCKVRATKKEIVGSK